MDSSLKCRVCDQTIPSDNIFNKSAVCSQCGFSFPLKRGLWNQYGYRIGVFGVSIIVVVATYFGYYARTKKFFDHDELSHQQLVDSMTKKQALKFMQSCLKDNDVECRLMAFKRLLHFSPKSAAYRSNYAFALTENDQHKQALSIYQSLLKAGVGTYDIMAYYGDSLNALGKYKAALKWYQNSLSIQPKLADVTKKLTRLFVQQNEPMRAASLLQSFISQNPEAKGYLSGDLLSIQELHLGKSYRPKKTNQIKLEALAGSHHYLPVHLGQSSKTAMFMIDSGASFLSMATSTFNQYFKPFARDMTTAKFKLGDGRVVSKKVAILSQIVIGSWVFKNIKVSFCEECPNLAGKSLMRHFTIQTKIKGQLEVMELVRHL